MADETAQTEVTEEEQFSKWLDGLAEEDDPAVEEAEEEDDVKQIALSAKASVEALRTEKELDAVVDKFLAGASDTAKELFTIYRTGDEDKRQLKRIMDLAVTKAAETEKTDEQITSEAEKLADQKAKQDYGVGPISGGQPATQATPQEYFDAQRETIRKKGDMHAAFGLWNALPPESEASPE